MNKKVTAALCAALMLLPLSAAARKDSRTAVQQVTRAGLMDNLQELAAPTRAKASSWRITPGDWSRELDALAVMNQGEHTSPIWIHQRAANGKIIQVEKIAPELLPDGSLGYIIGGPEGSLFTPVEGATFVIYADQALAVRAYRGTNAGDGMINLRNAPVQPMSKSESTRDERGVWFITGGTVYDLFEMQGYNEASDRLFQAVFYKHVARGRMAEVFGPDLVEQDVLARSSSYSDEELDAYFEARQPEGKAAVQGYVDGFNRRIAEVNANPALLPFEFFALGMTQVEPWSHRDVMAWVAALQRNFSSLGSLGLTKVENTLLLQELIETRGAAVGVAMWLDQRWKNDPQAPTMIPAGEEAKRAAMSKTEQIHIDPKMMKEAPYLGGWVDGMRGRFDRAQAELDRLGANVKGGSYAWAVSGSKTASGNPIIYSGPQMGFETPAIVMEGSMISEEANVHISGMTVIGIPGLIIGRTPHHAWSMQVGHTDTWDWYLEQPEDVFVHRVETINIAGSPPIEVPVLRSARGPVFQQAGLNLSWKYSSWGLEWEFQDGTLGLARAQSMEEFGAAVAQMGVTQHYCYVDRNGNIAYWMSGRRPVRVPGEYRLAHGLATPILDWDQNNLEPLYHGANPEQGFIAGWNNKATIDADNAGNALYGRYHRAEVVQKWLRENDNLTFEQVRDLAINISTTQAYGTGSGSGGGSTWPWLKDAFMASAARVGGDSEALVTSLFENYDEHRVAGGPEAWVFGQDVNDAWIFLDRWSSKVNDYMFSDEGTSGNNSFRLALLIRELNPDSAKPNFYRKWARNFTDPSAPQTVEAAIDLALTETIEELGPQPWGIGARGTLEYPHPLLGTFFPGTPWAARSTYAHCLEYDSQGPVRIESTFPTGQNGTLIPQLDGTFVPHPLFFGMKELYDSFTLRPFPLFDRDE